jgi:hypothetical protein
VIQLQWMPWAAMSALSVVCLAFLDGHIDAGVLLIGMPELWHRTRCTPVAVASAL